MASASGVPLNYHAFFDPRVRGFSWTLPIVIFIALMLSTQTYLLNDYGPKTQISWLRIWLDTFPYSQLGQVFSTAISACALVWLSFQLKSVWQIGIVFGAADALAGALGTMLAGLLRPSSSHTLLPDNDWQNTLLNILWGVFLVGSIGLAIRLRGLRAPVLAAAGAVAWILFGCAPLVFTLRWSWIACARWVLNGALFGLAAYAGLRAQLATGPSSAQRPDHQETPRISKGFYLTAISAGSMLGYLLIAGVQGSPRPNTSSSLVLFAGLLFTLLASIALLLLIKAMWTSIQDKGTRISPGRAVGFLFIPVFNFFWLFRVFWGFHKDYNEYIKRHSIPGAPLPLPLFLAGTLLVLAGVVAGPIGWWFPFGAVYLFVQSIAVAKICDAVDAIPA